MENNLLNALLGSKNESFVTFSKSNDLLIEGILRGLNRSGIYGEDATYELCNILKDMGRYDLLPPCFNDRS